MRSPVTSVSFQPGRGLVDGLLEVRTAAAPMGRYLLAGIEESEVTIDGTKANLALLLAWLAEHECTVELHPLVERYGASLKAEFTREEGDG